jgi:hypothetical protein
MDIAARIAAARAARPASFVDAHGACHASKEVADWWNQRHAMKANGATPEDMKAALEPSRRALRKAGHNI